MTTTPAASFWTQFEAALAAELVKVEVQVKAALQYITPMVEAGAAEVATVGLQAVLAQAPLLISGSEKLSAATASVISTLATSGKSVATSVAEAAVQGVVNKLALSGTKAPAA